MPEFESVRSKKKTKRKQPVLQVLFPCKGDSAGEIIRKIVFLTAIIVLIAATAIVINFYFFKPLRDDDYQNKIDEMRGPTSNDVISIKIKSTNSEGNDEVKEVKILEEYAEYYKTNNDTVGYLEIYPYVRMPIVQTTDNDFYLHHDFNKNPIENGTLFADYEVPITADSTPANTIIYGHNLITRNMFQPILNYRDGGLDFLKENYRINYDTIYEKNQYLIFAVMIVNFDPNRGEVFNYQNYVSFSNKSEFDNFIAECLDRSRYYTGIDIEYGDEILTLSTCDFSYSRYDTRLAIVARKVRDGESPELDTDKFIDNMGYDENGNFKRRMFEEYYKAYSTVYVQREWGGRKWDTSWIKDFEG